MSAVDRVGRLALGWVFVQAGTDVLRDASVPTTKAGPVLSALRSVVPVELPADEVLVRANAAAQVLAGSGVILGVLPRLSALVLLGSLGPTTAAGHRFWEFEPGAERNTQRNHFLKNISIAGGLLHVLTTPRRRGDGR
jgi:uncharacterized membrane protein YphA (DoxX/SURF4 family)